MNNHRLQPDTTPSAKLMPAIMIHALRTLFVLSLLAVAPAHANTPQQRWVGDLPIMDGMTIEPELGFAFDSPSGRIVLVFAAATASEAAILAYYDSALAIAAAPWRKADRPAGRASEPSWQIPAAPARRRRDHADASGNVGVGAHP